MRYWSLCKRRCSRIWDQLSWAAINKQTKNSKAYNSWDHKELKTILKVTSIQSQQQKQKKVWVSYGIFVPGEKTALLPPVQDTQYECTLCYKTSLAQTDHIFVFCKAPYRLNLVSVLLFLIVNAFICSPSSYLPKKLGPQIHTISSGKVVWNLPPFGFFVLILVKKISKPKLLRIMHHFWQNFNWKMFFSSRNLWSNLECKKIAVSV